MSYNVMVGKGARGRYTKRLTVKGEGFARLTAAMVPATHRAKITPTT